MGEGEQEHAAWRSGAVPFATPRGATPWGFFMAMTLYELWRTPAARAGRRLLRIEVALVPIALGTAVLAWDALVRWQGYPAFILPSPGRVWARFWR